jgi:N-acetyl-gamma-glutamyl-phosphate reductase
VTLLGAAQPAGVTVPAAARRHARIALLGASGYAGQEFARLALAHDGLELTALVSREHAGRPAAELLAGADPRGATLPPVIDVDALERQLEDGVCDTVVACLPHGAWRALSAERPRLAAAPRVIDLSSDFRDGSGGYVYGLPEAFRDAIAAATRIANPGCYPTALALALGPMAADLAGPAMVSALSGVSGAGRAPALRTSFVELEGGASFYKVGEEHVHVAEMERTLARLGARGTTVAFAPQLAPMARGILLTASAPLHAPLAPAAARARYAGVYDGERFVRVLGDDAWPETRAVRGSNRCDLGVTTVHGGRTLLVTAAIDNLVKGASGQAIQNLNLVLGWPEDWALPTHGTPW